MKNILFNYTINNLSSFFLLVVLLIFSGCGKEWLDIKRDKSLVVLQTLDDLQALLDNSSYMNNYQTPCLGEISADDLFVNFTQWNSAQVMERNAYVWNNEQHYSALPSGWFSAYQQIFYANIVLDGLSRKKEFQNEILKYNNLKGSSLFYRSWTFFQLIQVFCKSYDVSTATRDVGIPLRLEYDVNIPVKNTNLDIVYKQIISDLEEAVSLLPIKPLVKTRPSKSSAFALLAKTYLQMKDYKNAFLYSDSCLKISPNLLDYNELKLEDDYPLKKMNTEVIFHTTMTTTGFLESSVTQVDQLLLESYDSNDIRKNAFFSNIAGRSIFRGSYDQSDYFFSGIASDEVYLIYAESALRIGNKNNAIEALNTLLVKRHLKDTYIPIEILDDEILLSRILQERRKELVFRGIRWMDLKRLNDDDRFNKVIRRILNNQIFELTPNDNRYVLPFPGDVVIN